MSSDPLDRSNLRLFQWEDRFSPSDYIEATYYVESAIDPNLAAVAIAREQSASTTVVPGEEFARDFGSFTARVSSVVQLATSRHPILPPYRLNTPVYDSHRVGQQEFSCAEVKICFPIRNFDHGLTNLWNAIGGEVHRLGFLNTIRILDVRFPNSFLEQFEGPRHGTEGIKQLFRLANRPIFCRSTRPAVGLTTEMMLHINEAVLRGGFDAVKDDELTCDVPLSPFRDRVKRMVELVHRVEDDTGEKKMYIANVIDDAVRTLELADFAAEAGVHALLVSPALQGVTIARDLSRRTGLPILWHNSWEDVVTRHPKFGIHPALYITFQRLCGSDMVMLPGDFATDFMDVQVGQLCLEACTRELGGLKPLLPILAGGKTPDELRRYVNSVGSTDFMLIIASAVDTHPGGLEAGARAFRDAWDRIAS